MQAYFLSRTPPLHMSVNLPTTSLVHFLYSLHDLDSSILPIQYGMECYHTFLYWYIHLLCRTDMLPNLMYVTKINQTKMFLAILQQYSKIVQTKATKLCCLITITGLQHMLEMPQHHPKCLQLLYILEQHNNIILCQFMVLVLKCHNMVC